MDDEAVELAWKAALDAPDADDDAFATLDAALSGYAPPPSAPPSVPSLAPAPAPAPSRAPARSKRRNLSKELQLRCLRRYAEAARARGRLPDRTETQRLLERGYGEFLAAGGRADEPRLSPPEFLKLIRNRRREIQARASQAQPQAVVATKGRRRRGRPRGETDAKRRLQLENDKIQELIGAIDSVRERQKAQSGDQQRKSPPPIQLAADGDPGPLDALPALAADPQDQIEAILQVQRETRDVQREIAERVEAIQRMLRQHDVMEGEEPSSASV